MPIYKILKEVKKHIQNWKDIRIADIPKLSEIPSQMVNNINEVFGE